MAGAFKLNELYPLSSVQDEILQSISLSNIIGLRLSSTPFIKEWSGGGTVEPKINSTINV